MRHKNIECTLFVANRPAKEYKAQDQQQQHNNNNIHANCHVECTPEHNFHFVVDITGTYTPNPMKKEIKVQNDYLAEVYTDGVQRQRVHANSQGKVYIRNCMIRLPDGSREFRPYTFAPLKQIEDIEETESFDSVIQDKRVLDKLGTLEIKVCKFEIRKRTNPVGRPSNARKSAREQSLENLRVARVRDLSSKSVLEKSLKGSGVTNLAKLGGVVSTRKPGKNEKSRDSTFVYITEIVAFFHFKYLTRDALRAQMIIPLSPSPAPVTRPSPTYTPIDGPVDTLVLEIVKSEETDEKPVIQPEVIVIDSSDDEDDLIIYNSAPIIFSAISSTPRNASIDEQPATVQAASYELHGPPPPTSIQNLPTHSLPSSNPNVDRNELVLEFIRNPNVSVVGFAPVKRPPSIFTIEGSQIVRRTTTPKAESVKKDERKTKKINKDEIDLDTDMEEDVDTIIDKRKQEYEEPAEQINKAPKRKYGALGKLRMGSGIEIVDMFDD